MRKRTIFILLNGLAVFILALLPFGNDLIASIDNLRIKLIVTTILLDYKFYSVLMCSGYITIHTILPSWLLPRKERNKLKKAFLNRIIAELLSNDTATHRVTLFKEVSYVRAFIRNYFYLINHLLFYANSKWRWQLYIKPPKRGRYLIVDSRCGQDFKWSSTMFRVETSDIKFCAGVAGLIRFKKMKLHIPNLPDLTGINFEQCKSEDNLTKAQKRNVKKYMKDGYIDNFSCLRKMHKIARHFLGATISKQDGSPWGILLIDSTSGTDPFDKNLTERFNSFALSISAIIDLGD